MKHLLKANFRVLAGSPVTGAILVLFALISGFVSSFLYYGNVPMANAYETSLTQTNVEQLRFLPTLDLTGAEVSEIQKAAGTLASADSAPSLPELVSNHDVDLLPYYDKRATALSEHFDFVFEGIQIKVIDSGGVRYQVTTKPESINRLVVVDGAAEPDPGQVLVTVQYARLQGLGVGDSLSLDGRTYQIAGTYYQPADSYVGGTSDAARGNASNAGIVMSPSDFSGVDALAETYYVGIPNTGASAAAILDGMRSSQDVSYVTDSTRLPSTSALRNNFSTSLTLMLIGTALFSLAVVLVIWQIIRNNLRRSVAVVGVLKAIGLHPVSIGLSFAVYVLPVIVGVATGSIAGYLLAPSFSDGYLDLFNFYSPEMRLDARFTAIQLILAILVPFAVCMTTAMRLVGAETLSLLDGRFNSSSTLRLRRLYSAMRGLRLAARVRWSFALSNAPRLLVVVVSAAVSVTVLAFSLAILSMGTQPLGQLRESMNFDYLVTSSTPQTSSEATADKGFSDRLYVTDVNGQDLVERSYDAMFVEPSFEAITAPGPTGAQVFEQLSDGNAVVVSSKFAADFKVVAGDLVSIQPQNLPSVTFEVVGVNPVAMDTRLYFNERDLARAVPGTKAGTYNTKFLSGGAAPESDATQTVTSRSVVVENAQEAISASFRLVPMLALIAVVLSSGVLFLIAYLNVNDNRRMIALLDQMGYQARDSIRLVINVYGLFIVVGALAGATAAPTLLGIFGDLVSQASDYHLRLDTNWIELAALIVSVACFAQLSHFLVLPWVRRISPSALSYA